jgi:hypothetical protein
MVDITVRQILCIPSPVCLQFLFLSGHTGSELQLECFLVAFNLRMGSRVRFPAGAGNVSLHHRVQNGSGAHPASYPVGTGGSFPGGKAAGA